MKGCKKCRDRLVETLYGDLDPEQKTFFKNHIASCPSCAAEFKALTETLKTMDKRVRPEPGQDFWNGYWDRLSQRMEEERVGQEESSSWGKAFSRIWSLRARWAFQAVAAAGLLVIGVLIGRMVFSPERPPVDSAQRAEPVPSVQPGQDDPVLRARSYVDRSKLVLLALVNYDPRSEDPYGLDLPSQKRISQELVSQAGEIKSDLRDPSQRRLRELVADLETILLQIANLASKNDLEAVEFVKQGVESRGLLFKINLSEMGGHLSRGGQETAPEKPSHQKTKI